jgi:hypothetical protein
MKLKGRKSTGINAPKGQRPATDYPATVTRTDPIEWMSSRWPLSSTVEGLTDQPSEPGADRAVFEVTRCHGRLPNT